LIGFGLDHVDALGDLGEQQQRLCNNSTNPNTGELPIVEFKGGSIDHKRRK
jgi:hypothetical protein